MTELRLGSGQVELFVAELRLKVSDSMNDLHRQQSPLRQEWLIKAVLAVFILAIVGIYISILSRYPYQNGSDAFYHTWVVNQILEHGRVPLASPTSNVLSIYSFTPFLHLSVALIVRVFGVAVVTAMTWLNVVAVALYGILVFAIARATIRRSILALAATFFAYLLYPEFFYYFPRNLALLEFLFIFWICLRSFQAKRLGAVRAVAILIAAFALFETHLLAAAYGLAIIGSFLLAMFFQKAKKVSLGISALIIVAATGYLVAHLSLFRQGLFPINLSDTAFTTAVPSTDTVVAVGSSAVLPLTSVFVVFGVLMLIRRHRQAADPAPTTALLAWLLATTLIYFQSYGGFSFLPERIWSYFAGVMAILFVLGLDKVFRPFGRRVGRGAMAVGIVGLAVVPFFTTMLSPKFPPVAYGMPRVQYNELRRVQRSVPTGSVLSDPITMYVLTTIDDFRPAYQYDHSSLTRKTFINWGPVQALFYGTTKARTDYLRRVRPQYVVVSSQTRALFDDIDWPSLERLPELRLIYTSPTIDRSTLINGRSANVPYYVVYQYDATKANK